MSSIRFGICADLHTEYIPDSVSRMKTFLKKSVESNVDFCIQLGDFCPPGELNLKDKIEIFELIKNSNIPFYHTLGNHDMDRNCKKAVLDFYKIDSSYYSYDVGELHFVVLDGCYFKTAEEYVSYDTGNYKKVPCDIAAISKEQLNWLEKDLMQAKYPSVLFSHQSLVKSRASICNSEDLMKILKKAPNKVIAAFCGHEHVERAELIDGIWFYCVNGMSYYWCGSKYSHSTYGEKIESEYPQISKVFPFKDPLFAIVEITDNSIVVTGRESEFVGKSPSDLNFIKEGLDDPITTSIKNTVLRLK